MGLVLIILIKIHYIWIFHFFPAHFFGKDIFVGIRIEGYFLSHVLRILQLKIMPARSIRTGMFFFRYGELQGISRHSFFLLVRISQLIRCAHRVKASGRHLYRQQTDGNKCQYFPAKCYFLIPLQIRCSIIIQVYIIL
ncbi:hypothetical protein D3C87_1384070 [compost metagenome]